MPQDCLAKNPDVVRLPSDIPIDEIVVEHGCIVQKGTQFHNAISMGTALNTEIVDTLSNLAVDVLFMVDDQRTVFKIAENLGRQVERIIGVVRYCVSKHIVEVEVEFHHIPEVLGPQTCSRQSHGFDFIHHHIIGQ